MSEQIELAQALAHQATLAMQLTRLAEEAKQVAIAREQEKAAQNRALQLAKTNEVLRRSLTHLTQESDLDIYLNQVLLTIVHQVGAVLGHIFIYNAKRNELAIKVRVAEGRIVTEIPPDEPEMFRTPFSADITPAYRHLCQSGEVLCLQRAQLIDIEQPGYFWPKNLEWHRHQGHTEVAALALTVGNQPVGFLGLAFKGRPPLEPEEKELVQALAQQATLAIQLTRLSEQGRESAVLEERNRMAREIHDTLAQAFTGVIIQLEAAEEIVATQPNEAQAHLIRASSLAREGLTEARRSVRALRPEALESNDLPKALRRLVQQMTDGLALRADICVIGTPRRLPTEIESNLLRIGQEALTNALRHAKAQTILLKLLFEVEVVHLQIIDDGQGFEPQLQANSGCGIIGMQERSQQIGAELILNSRIGQGTEIKVSVPTP
jgi:signal transduction histidine kinase